MTDTTTTPQELRAREIEHLRMAYREQKAADMARFFGDEDEAYDHMMIAQAAIYDALQCALEANALDADAALPAASPITQTPTQGDTQ